MSEATRLNNAGDWHWYKATLDLANRHVHEHGGNPERYPCLVTSRFWDDPNGPYCYDHTFTYGSFVITTCKHCGHSSEAWEWKTNEVRGG